VKRFAICCFLCCAHLLNASETFAPPPEIEQKVLATANGRAITSFEVQKKMDQVFDERFPEYHEMPDARIEFYHYAWKEVLRDLIDRELILTDALEKSIPVPDGDIRQELEEVFGPNLYQTLEKNKISYDEAWAIVKNDILIRRMLYYRVNSKVAQQITPKVLTEAYHTLLSETPPKDIYSYKVLSATAKKETEFAQLEKIISSLNVPGFDSLEDLYDTLLLETALIKGAELNVSPNYEREDKQLSESHKTILAGLTDGKISAPCTQTSRAQKKQVLRIFYLEKHVKQEPPTFEQVQKELEQNVTNKLMDIESKKYMEKLHTQFHTEQIANADSPFEQNVPTTL